MTPRSSRSGVLLAGGSYVLWGFMPAYFALLSPVGPFEIVAWRVLLSLGFCALLLTALRAWRPVLALARDRRILGALAAAGVVIYVNWQVFVIASMSGRVVEASIGYFINPLISVLLGVVLLKERLRIAQWIAVGLSAMAVLVITIGYGAFPWIALALAIPFAIYGYLKKRVAHRVDALGGLTIETALLAPVAAVQLGAVAVTGGIRFGATGAVDTVLLALAGVATAAPLLLFAAATRRLTLAAVGVLQYICPVIQLVVGVVVLHEPMTAARWAGLALIWVGLAVFTLDSLVSARSGRSTVIDPV